MNSKLSIYAFKASKLIRLNLVLLIAFAFTLSSRSFAQQHIPWDSLIIGLENAKTDTARLYYLNYLGYYEREGLRDGSKYLKEGLALAKSSKYLRYEGAFLVRNGEYNYSTGDYSQALEYFQNAVELSEEHDFNSILITANFDIGLLYFNWKNNSKAYEYMQKALEISKASGDTVYPNVILNGLGSVLDEMKDHEKAKEYMLSYKYECEKIGIPSELFLAYNNLGIIYKKLNQLDSSIYYTRKGLEIAKEQKDTLQLLNIYISIIEYYILNNKIDSSRQYVYASLGALKQSHPATWRINSYKYISLFYQKAEIADSALLYMNMHYNLKDSLYNKEQLNKMTDLETSFETKRYQDKIDFLEQQNKMQSIQLYGSIAGLISIFLILLLGYRSYKLKLNLQKQNQQLADEKSTVMKERIEFQKRESATNALYIVKQNRLYDGLLKDLKKLGKTSDEDRASALKSIIFDIQKGKKTTEKKDFEIKFKHSHQNFYKNMKEQYPELTKRELDLCAYLTLNMSTKEIASLSNTSVRAIEVSRSRLRKKLEVQSGVNLSEFIRSI